MSAERKTHIRVTDLEPEARVVTLDGWGRVVDIVDTGEQWVIMIAGQDRLWVRSKNDTIEIVYDVPDIDDYKAALREYFDWLPSIEASAVFGTELIRRLLEHGIKEIVA